MEDELNGRQPKWKMNSMEDDLIENDLNWIGPHWKMTSMEDDLNVRRPQWKKTSMEDNLKKALKGRQP